MAARLHPLARRPHVSARHQRGITMIVALVFLVIMMIVALSAMKVATLNTKIVSNQQFQTEADLAAQQGLEYTVSNDFSTMTSAYTMLVDSNDSGKTGAQYTVTVQKPSCLGVTPIYLDDSTLDLSSGADNACTGSLSAANSGILASTTGTLQHRPSLCSSSKWDLRSSAAGSTGSATSTTVHQGMAMRVLAGTSCPN